MAEKEYFADDRCIIPDYIKQMSAEELDREIARLEAEAKAEKERNLKQNSWLNPKSALKDQGGFFIRQAIN